MAAPQANPARRLERSVPLRTTSIDAATARPELDQQLGGEERAARGDADPLERLAVRGYLEVLRHLPGIVALYVGPEAAMAADFPRTACLSLEILMKGSNKDYDLAMQYGQALARCGCRNPSAASAAAWPCAIAWARSCR